MKENSRVLANADIAEIEVAPPAGHVHLRATLKLQSGESIVLQEATLASLLRAYVSIKTHPLTKSVRLVGQELNEAERKKGFAEWQFLEVENEETD